MTILKIMERGRILPGKGERRLPRECFFSSPQSCRGAVGQAVISKRTNGSPLLPKRAFSALRFLTKSRGAGGDAPAEGVLDEVGQFLQVEFPHNVVPVPAHRKDADIQEVRDFLGSLAFGQKLDDGLFPEGKGIGVGRLVPQGQIRHLGGQEG